MGLDFMASLTINPVAARKKLGLIFSDTLYRVTVANASFQSNYFIQFNTSISVRADTVMVNSQSLIVFS